MLKEAEPYSVSLCHWPHILAARITPLRSVPRAREAGGGAKNLPVVLPGSGPPQPVLPSPRSPLPTLWKEGKSFWARQGKNCFPPTSAGAH